MSSPPVATAVRPPYSGPSTPNVERLKSLLRTPFRVTVSDGRIFLGSLAGTDKQLNLILVNTDEYRIGPDADEDAQNGRYVGQVMIPWRLVVRVEARPPPGSRVGAYEDSDDESMYA